MTLEEIKTALAVRGMTQADLAKQLGCNAKALNEVLRGARPLTDAMHNHICLLLKEPREAVLVYRVDIGAAKAQELLGAKSTVNPADRPAAIESVIHHNLQELIELGKKCDWTEDERQFLGIPPAGAPTAPPAQPYPPSAQEPFA